MSKFLGVFSVVFLPAIVSAQTNFDIRGIEKLINDIGRIIQTAIPFVAALALLFFFYGLAKFILAAGNDDAREEGKKIMLWGVIALFVMAAIWGIIQAVANLFGVSTGGSIDVPTTIF